jgi:hypothetical protein
MLILIHKYILTLFILARPHLYTHLFILLSSATQSPSPISEETNQRQRRIDDNKYEKRMMVAIISSAMNVEVAISTITVARV